jgi:hypothetical protein|tara:strand:- start:437 stop:628 length:192 start_codon:yes stop_codon:yes gene_type:complete
LSRNIAENSYIEVSEKRKFYVALYYREHLTIFQDPKAKISDSAYTWASRKSAMVFNQGQMLRF